MNFVLFDDIRLVKTLMPLTYTRPIGDIRVGILKIVEKWEHMLNQELSWKTRSYLSDKFKLHAQSDNVLINGSVLPNAELIEAILQLPEGMKLMQGDKLVAYRTAIIPESLEALIEDDGESQQIDFQFTTINNAWDIFQKNGEALEADFDMLTSGRVSAAVSPTNQVLGNRVFLEEGASVECCILNSTTGPIYIGRNAQVMEGSVIRGGFALCDHSTVKMGAKIYGPTTIGPHSKVGGEISNSVVLGYSNKGHDGFMGNSVLGEWCNLGADTNTSNLKNNYSHVKVWSYEKEDMADTGLQFCGLLMGDHSKSGINTMFNTGTVVGVCANVFGGGFPPKFIPSFSWGGAEGLVEFRLEKAFELADKMMQRRAVQFDTVEEDILTKVFTSSTVYRAN